MPGSSELGLKHRMSEIAWSWSLTKLTKQLKKNLMIIATKRKERKQSERRKLDERDRQTMFNKEKNVLNNV